MIETLDKSHIPGFQLRGFHHVPSRLQQFHRFQDRQKGTMSTTTFQPFQEFSILGEIFTILPISSLKLRLTGRELLQLASRE